MGNRGGVEIIHFVRDDGAAAKVCLYSHYEGCFLAEYVRHTLGWAKDRWTDPSYLTKFIAFDLAAGAPNDALNVAIEPELEWIQHRVVLVDVPVQKVRFVNPHDRTDVSGEWSFEKYLRVPPKTLDRAYHRGFGGEMTAEAAATLRDRLRRLSPPQRDPWLADGPPPPEQIELFKSGRRRSRKARDAVPF